MRRKIINTLILALCLSSGMISTSVSAQKYLQVENYKGKVLERYGAGDEVAFLLHNDPVEHHGSIMRLDPDNNLIYFEGWVVSPDSLSGIRSRKTKTIRRIGQYLFISGGVALINSVLATLIFKPDNSKPFLIISGSMTAAGLALKAAGRKNKLYHIPTRYKTRMIDLTFYN
ncbi:MAG TPA: hypothetical protein PK076_03680 [Saprospiraceae bacterium]|nr:hypothetical protein [Saprospiraceae bacterium]HQW55196.1 hypothetical protein [Saprospiraceae bacterium]